jgi:D-sedoheptulose 7-phosphate isomerase
MTNINKIKNIFLQNAKMFESLSDTISESISNAADLIINSYKNSGKIIIFGNGGSAADALHFVAEMVGRFQKEREPLPAIALNTNVSNITAISNDYGYENLFLRQLKPFLKKEDVVIGISTSGNSDNIILAMEYANNFGAKTISLTGYSGGKLASITNINININIRTTARVQEGHITILHILAELIENALFA